MNVKMSETRFENELTGSWLQGKLNGLQDTIAYLNKEAGAAFAGRQDERAEMLRKVADLLEEKLLSDCSAAKADFDKAHLAGEPDIEMW